MTKRKLPKLPNRPSDDINAVYALVLHEMHRIAIRSGEQQVKYGRRGRLSPVNVKKILAHLYREVPLAEAEFRTALAKVRVWLGDPDNMRAYVVGAGRATKWFVLEPDDGWPELPEEPAEDPPAPVDQVPPREPAPEPPGMASVHDLSNRRAADPEPEVLALAALERAHEDLQETVKAELAAVGSTEVDSAPGGDVSGMVAAVQVVMRLPEADIRALCVAMAQRLATLGDRIKGLEAERDQLSALAQLAVGRPKA